jgi:hypothetical protein
MNWCDSATQKNLTAEPGLHGLSPRRLFNKRSRPLARSRMTARHRRRIRKRALGIILFRAAIPRGRGRRRLHRGWDHPDRDLRLRPVAATSPHRTVRGTSWSDRRQDGQGEPGATIGMTQRSSEYHRRKGRPSRSFPTALPARKQVSLEVMGVDAERHNLITARRFMSPRAPATSWSNRKSRISRIAHRSNERTIITSKVQPKGSRSPGSNLI